MTFYDLILDMTHHHFCYILFIKNEPLSMTHTQQEEKLGPIFFFNLQRDFFLNFKIFNWHVVIVHTYRVQNDNLIQVYNV